MTLEAENKHIGSSFDDFMAEDDLLTEVEAVALKRVLAFQLEQEMKRSGLTKSQLANKMETSRSAVDRLLDPENQAVTLRTLDDRQQRPRSAVAFSPRTTTRCPRQLAHDVHQTFRCPRTSADPKPLAQMHPALSTLVDHVVKYRDALFLLAPLLYVVLTAVAAFYTPTHHSLLVTAVS